jgi:tetratricopeptide (TPR) repeat protein
MAILQIREHHASPGEPNASVRIGGRDHPAYVANPFTPVEERRLEWYFEEWLRFPFDGVVQAAEAAGSIARYGESLFRQVFADPEALAGYRDSVRSETRELRIEVVGSPGFHALHWEALKDPDAPRGLALDAIVIRRDVKAADDPPPLPPSPTLNVAVLTARPFGAGDVAYRTISRLLVESLEAADVPVRVEIVSPGTYLALAGTLQAATARHGPGFYHVVHVDAHGALLTYDDVVQGFRRGAYVAPGGRIEIEPFEGSQAFLFLDVPGEPRSALLPAVALARLLARHGVPIAVLNACQSAKSTGTSESSLAARLTEAGVQAVLAMGYSVTVSAARLVMGELYPRLFAGEPLSEAVRCARIALAAQRGRQAYFDQEVELEDWMLPVLYENGPTALRLRPMTADEAAAHASRRARTFAAPAPEYGFWGRDLDIHRIQERLLVDGNLLLVRGMGGAGKTTLLRHLGAWWQTTHRVEQVFFFAWDARSWTCAQVLDGIARALLGEEDYHARYVPLLADDQLRFVKGALRMTRHLLVLDNLESITGTHFAVPNTLGAQERERLHGFLRGLAGGETLVLLGSRGPEAWLAAGTFGDNVYELPGLDPEAASSLSNRILVAHGAEGHREDPALVRLLDFLGGYPLAMEVVLPNLASQSPGELLEALGSGAPLDSEDLSARLLHCIDYSYGNLAPEMQGLVVGLAPFVGVIDSKLFPTYIKYMVQLPRFSNVAPDQWTALLDAMTGWGLLTPDADLPWFLHIHPLLRYFVARKLDELNDPALLDSLDFSHFGLFLNSCRHLVEMLYGATEQRNIAEPIAEREQENLRKAVEYGTRSNLPFEWIFATISLSLEYRGAHHEGTAYCERILGLLDVHQPADVTEEALAWNRHTVLQYLATFRLAGREYEAAVSTFESLLSHLENAPRSQRNIKRAGDAHQQLGRIGGERRDFESARKHYAKAMEEFQLLGDRGSLGSLYHQQCALAMREGEFATAERLGIEALTIYEEFGLEERMLGTLGQLAIVAVAQDQLGTATARFQAALQLCHRVGSAEQYSYLLANFGTFVSERGNWGAARLVFRQALEHARAIQNIPLEATVYRHLGAAALEAEEWQDAILHLTKAVHLAVETEDAALIADIYRLNATGAFRVGHWIAAQDWASHALRVSLPNRDSYGIGEGFRLLARTWHASGSDEILTLSAKILEMDVERLRELLLVAREHDDGE